MSEREIFAEALLRADPSERATYLDGACGSDGAARSRIEDLLALHERDLLLLDRQPQELLNELGVATKEPEPHLSSSEATARQLASFLSPSERPGALGRLGQYDVLEVLGQGGHGIVVKAFDSSLQRVVAIKILAPHLAVTSPPRKRFLREAQASAQVKHENVVQVHAVGEEPLPFLVMEFVEGQTLQEKIDTTGPLDALEVVRLGVHVLRGLAAAHEKGLIHRDVKPANILLEAGIESRARLTDFGLARAGDDASLTQSGVIAGTPLYMSPEQATGEVLDCRADLFSFGSVLYTMVTGRPPFRAPNTLAVLKRVAEDAPRPIREVLAGVPAGLCAVIMRLLQKKPNDRFATASEAADALGRCLTDPVPVPAAARRRRVFAVAAAAVLLLLTGTAWVAGPYIRPHLEGGRPQNGPVHPPAVRPAEDTPGGIVVTSVADDDSEGTLRWAIAEANTRSGSDTITFDPIIFSTSRTITLAAGPLLLTDLDVTTITGPPSGVTISGANKTKVFVIGETKMPAAAFFSGLTISHGLAPQESALGGGILCKTRSTLTLVDCTLRDNAAPFDGGGGIFNLNGTVTLTNCTFTRNQALMGGGVKNYGSFARLKAVNCTFARNTANSGVIYTNGAGRTEVYNCLFNANPGNNLHIGEAGEVTGDHNLTDDFSAPGPNSQTAVDARLGTLGRHGGPTETIPLLSDSPAIDAGSNAHVPSEVKTDQRRQPRIAGGTVDLGAYEAR